MIKLNSSSNVSSFYETFSDLIFATMAIFVLLMIIFIVQINLEIGLEDLEKLIEETKVTLQNKKKDLVNDNKKLEQLKQSKQSLQQYNFEVVIAVDTTGSMQIELNQLTDTIGLIAKILPKIANTVKMGVVAYRRDESNRVVTKTFPIQLIRDKDLDKSKSYHKIYRFVSSLKAKAGSAPIEAAMDEALKMFSSAKEFTGHQTFMLLGDVGPYEDRYQDQEIDSRNRQQEQAMTQQLKIWSSESLHRNILVLFSGDDEIAKTGGEQHQKFVQSRQFFENLAIEAGQTDSFTNNSSEMIPHLLSAILK